LGRSPIVASELAAGRLVAPFDVVLVSRAAYWIVYPQAVGAQSKMVAFRDWLLAEARQSE